MQPRLSGLSPGSSCAALITRGQERATGCWTADGSWSNENIWVKVLERGSAPAGSRWVRCWNPPSLSHHTLKAEGHVYILLRTLEIKCWKRSVLVSTITNTSRIKMQLSWLLQSATHSHTCPNRSSLAHGHERWMELDLNRQPEQSLDNQHGFLQEEEKKKKDK